MLIPCDEVNILNTFRVMIILRLLLLLTNLHLKLLSTLGTGADKLLSTQRVKTRRVIFHLSVNGCQSGVNLHPPPPPHDARHWWPYLQVVLCVQLLLQQLSLPTDKNKQ